MTPLHLRDSFYQAAVRTERAAGHNVLFETGIDADPETAPSYAAAASAASEALVVIGGRPGGKCALAGLTAVVLTQGAATTARLSAGRLVITIAPAAGGEGIPSVDRIEDAIRSSWFSCA